MYYTIKLSPIVRSELVWHLGEYIGSKREGRMNRIQLRSFRLCKTGLKVLEGAKKRRRNNVKKSMCKNKTR